MPDSYPCKVVDSEGKEKIYKMRKCTWFDDAALTARLVDANGQPVFREIWIARLSRDVEGITEADLRKMDRQTFSTLIYYWTLHNDTNPQSFLENPQQIPADSSQSNSISSATK